MTKGTKKDSYPEGRVCELFVYFSNLVEYPVRYELSAIAALMLQHSNIRYRVIYK